MLTSEDLKRIKEDRGPLDLTLKIEQLNEDNIKLKKRVEELDNSLTIALEINDKYQRENATLLKNRPLDTMDEVAYRELQAENEKLKKKVREAEGETSIVKGIGMNSPEMKESQKRIKELADKCREAGRAMIELNLKYEAALEENKDLKKKYENK